MSCRLTRVARATAIAVYLLVTSDGAAGQTTKIAVGAKPFTESAVLAEVMAQTIEAYTDIVVERRLNLAGTHVCLAALRGGEIDLYAEYTGTGLRDILGDKSERISPGLAFATVAKEFARRFDLEWLAPFGFDNTYVLLMRPQHAAELAVTKVSDLSEHPLRFGVSHEFLSRPDGLPGLRKVYTFQESHTVGMAHDLAYQGLVEGSIDVTDGYSTDAKILRYGLATLADDRHFFPPYEAAPLARRDLAERVPEAYEALRLLAGRIDAAAMRDMNFQVEQKRRAPAAVAADFLGSLGIVADRKVHSERETGVFRLLYQRRWKTLDLASRHLMLAGGAVLAACLIGIPLGIAVSRRPALAKIVLGFASVLQTIPSIALLAFMLPLFGIGVAPALVALFLYGLLPIMRNTVTGLHSIEDRLLDVGRGLGMTDSQILQQVELPLAAPVLMAGVRTATVITVGTATLAAFIGAGGLGDPIVTGLATTDYALVLCGALPAAALAIALDWILGQVERWVTPSGLRE